MRPLADFLDLILPHAPACPDLLAETELRNAAITFCQRARCWRMLDDHILPEDWQGDISFSLPVYARLHEIEKAWFNTQLIDRADYADVLIRLDEGRQDLSFTSLRDRLAGAGHLRLSLFLKPSATAAELPDMLFEDHRALLAAGALGTLLRMPAVSWTNPQLALVFAAEFERGCDRFFAENIRGRMRRPVRSKPRFM